MAFSASARTKSNTSTSNTTLLRICEHLVGFLRMVYLVFESALLDVIRPATVGTVFMLFQRYNAGFLSPLVPVGPDITPRLLPRLAAIYTIRRLISARYGVVAPFLIPYAMWIRCILDVLLPCIIVVGTAFLYALHLWMVHVVFNRVVPSSLSFGSPTWGKTARFHLSMLRPVECLFRLATYKLRVLPDIIVLGEVRCGTTTLCHHIRNCTKYCRQPFCLWDHPELGDKETFFFVGHYFGIVDPELYRMCFPLQLTKFVQTRILRRPFFTFDGCAQYLTSPSAPYLIAFAYKKQQRAPILVACTRNPTDQAVSWWKFENDFMVWGDSLGLQQYNELLRGPFYPPRSIVDALNLSMSEPVADMYCRAEILASRAVSSPSSLFSILRMPAWALTVNLVECFPFL
mmetsp:Transcript_35986/g.84013  ORF Transcript_35986/g.84013 Transcript_35986/m.84013 type:complete len:402 (-) Transcript_35986:590-1795(-)